MARCALLGALTVAMVACGEPEPAPSTIFVGQIPSAEAAVAVVAGAHAGSDPAEAVVYVCDGVDTTAWFFGTVTGDVIEAESDDGAVVQARVVGGQVTGLVDLPALGAVEFSAPLAAGVAGIYLVEQSATRADGYSASGARLEADITTTAGGATVLGTVTLADRGPIALQGAVSSFGEAAGVATWIVQSDGEVKGRVTNTAGGGNCSIWSKIKSIAFGVDCTFF